MKKKCILAYLVIFLLLCGCQAPATETTTPAHAGFTGDVSAYERRHTGRWERAWEEDILFFAEKYLTEHSRISEGNFFTDFVPDLSGSQEVIYDNSAFDPALRTKFIESVDDLLQTFQEMSDEAIINELHRIVALLGDIHSSVFPEDWDYGEILPVCYEAFYREEGVDFRVSIVDVRNEELLGAKLISYNGIRVEEIVERLSAYMSHESDRALGFMLTQPYMYTGLNEKNLLAAAGIVGEDDPSLTAEFETAEGIESVRIGFRAYDDMPDLELHPMMTVENLRFSNLDGYWWTMIDDSTLYAQLTTMVDHPGYSIDNLFSEVRNAMRDSQVPLKVILDFRGNGGGYVHESTLQGFVNAAQWYDHDGIYILIDGNCFSAGVLAPYYLRQAIPGAKLVGAPTGQGLWFPANSSRYALPNNGVGFTVGDEIICAVRGWEGDAVEPDALVYQTFEDYENMVDTVLAWAMAD